MNVYYHEMKSYRKSILIWGSCLVLYYFLVGAKMSALDTVNQDVNALMEGLPRVIQVMMGGQLDISTTAGYYGVCFVYILLMGAIHAVLLGTNILAKEEQERTIEFLMVKPISRDKILLEKMAATFSNVCLFNLVSFGASLVFLKEFDSSKSLGINELLVLHMGLLFTQLIFMSIGFAIASTHSKAKSAGSLSIGILLATYFLSIMVSLSEKIDFLKYFTPFKYFEVEPIIHGDSWAIEYYVLSILLILIGLSITFFSYKKREFTS